MPPSFPFSPPPPPRVRSWSAIRVVVAAVLMRLAVVLRLIASLLGFTAIAGASFAVAQVVAGIFLVLFVIILLLAWAFGARCSSKCTRDRSAAFLLSSSDK